MPQSRTTKRLARDALGIKALITTTSLAVTLGGWAALAVEHAQTPSSEAPIADRVALNVPASSLELNLAPLPTIVQAAPPPPKVVVANPPSVADKQNGARRPVIQIVSQPIVEPSPAAAPQPAPAAPPLAVSLPPLRVVSAPPKPVARTRSSR